MPTGSVSIPPVTSVSDYVIVTGGTRTFQVPGDLGTRFEFSLPENLIRGQRAVMTWRLRLRNPENLEFHMRINGDTQFVMTWSGPGLFTTMQEVISGDLLRAGTNVADFDITEGTGRVDVSDIVVYFQVKV